MLCISISYYIRLYHVIYYYIILLYHIILCYIILYYIIILDYIMLYITILYYYIILHYINLPTHGAGVHVGWAGSGSHGHPSSRS